MPSLKKTSCIILITSTIGTTCTIYYTQYRNYTPIYKEPLIIEYGDTDIKKEDLLEDSPNNKNIVITDIQNIDTKKLDHQEVNIETKQKQRSKIETKEIEVRDTKPPIIELAQDQIEIAKGDDFKEEKNIISIHDPVDGKIQNMKRGCMQEYNMFLRNRMRKVNCVFIGSDVDVRKPDVYEVKIVSYDAAGNCSMRSFLVRVQEYNGKSRAVNMQNDTIRDKTNWIFHNQTGTETLEDAFYDPSMPPDWMPLDLLWKDMDHIYSTYEEAKEAYDNLQDNGHWQIQELSDLVDNKGQLFSCFMLVNTVADYMDHDCQLEEKTSEDSILPSYEIEKESSDVAAILNAYQ